MNVVMRLGRSILTLLLALSLAMLPMARAFVAFGDEAVTAHGVNPAANLIGIGDVAPCMT